MAEYKRLPLMSRRSCMSLDEASVTNLHLQKQRCYQCNAWAGVAACLFAKIAMRPCVILVLESCVKVFLNACLIACRKVVVKPHVANLA